MSGSRFTKGRYANSRISCLVWTREKVIKLAMKLSRQLVSMSLDSKSTRDLVLTQTYTALGLHIEENPGNEEFKLADVLQ